MRILLLLLVAVACKKPAAPAVDPASTKPTPAATTPAPEGEKTVTAERPPPDVAALQAVARRLAIRDPAPDCQELADSMESEPKATLLYAVNTMEQPPWAPMRAAGCLIELYPEGVASQMTDWVSKEELAGLGKLVLARLAGLPEATAVQVVSAGLKGPLAQETREAAAGSEREAVRALVTE